MKNQKALHISPKAKKSTFVDCDIEGVKDEGVETLMIKTRILNFRKDHPKLWINLIRGLLIGIILLFIEYFYFKNI